MLAGLALLIPTWVQAAEPATKEVLVKLENPDIIPEELRNDPLASLGIVSLPIPGGESATSFADQINSQPGVAWAEVDGSFRMHTIPNDPLWSSQTGLAQTQPTTAWDSSRGTHTVRIGVIDTGIDGEHIDLTGRVDAGWNFITNTAIPANTNSDDNGHGTLISGVIGAITNNGEGIAGVDWSARLIPLKVANALGQASASALAAAIVYAADNGIKAVNISLGGPGDFQVVRDAVTYASSRGVSIVGSSGNNNSVVNDAGDCANVCYPAAYPEVIAVGSVDEADSKSSFSNYGADLDLVAPGESILSTELWDHASYTTASGTSLSSPFVTGAIGLLLARFDTSPAAIQTILQNAADKPAGMGDQNFTNEYGYGRLNLAKAIRIHASYYSQNSNPTLYPGESYEFELQLRNTGDYPWQRASINLGTDQARDRTPVFTRGAGWLSTNRVELIEASVAAGDIGTFRFTYTVPDGITPGTYREYFRPVYDGVGWLEDMAIYWDITVLATANKYHAAWVSQNSYPTLLAGQSYQFEVVLKNTGTTDWVQSVVKLGTSRDFNRTSVFTRATGWLDTNRVEMVETTVAPNNNGTFRFTLTVPDNLAAGTYREYFQPLAEHITWMEDFGIYWDIRVITPVAGYHAELVFQNDYPTLDNGQSYQFEAQYRNVGAETWQQGTVNLGSDHPRDRTPVFTRGAGWLSTNRIELVEASVAPGDIGTFQFTLTVPIDLDPGIYREYFSPVADGVTWMEDTGMHWAITVQ